jgi:Cu+-exporting ATPase
VIDPVCGMRVTPETAAAAWEYEGTTCYFCSIGCMQRFKEDPEGYRGLDPGQRTM